MQKSAERGNDLRVQRSRILLQQALFDLTVEKGFEAVTVRDITERAMVNRSTFYRHYLDKYDLLDQYLDTLQAKVAEAAQQAEEAGSMSADAVPAGLLMLIKHVQEYAAFYRVVLGKGGDQKIVQRFRQFSEARLRFMFERQSEPSDPKAPPIEMRMRCVSFAGIGAILWWLENNQPCSAEQLAIWLGQLNMTAAGIVVHR